MNAAPATDAELEDQGAPGGCVHRALRTVDHDRPARHAGAGERDDVAALVRQAPDVP